ncbi:hypothetical protein LJC46_05170 [Desulfovibrio sp. OttesenSCG-928-G15]|nr:hypothetical protein [Desulfovibrio sp. OttesenSCG-928-G15]
MSILRPISIVLRNFLVKQHPYFSCCASCGEIKTPLEGRLCTSLLPEFPVDAVILPYSTGKPGAGEASIASAVGVKRSAPWLRRVYVMEKNPPSKNSPGFPPYARQEAAEGIVLCDPDTLRSDPVFREFGPVPDNPHSVSLLQKLPTDALLHAIPGIAEHFIVLHAPASAKLDSVLDYYTPNGIPLIYVNRVPENTSACCTPTEALTAMRDYAASEAQLYRRPIPGAYPQTKDSSASFFPGFLDIARARLAAFPQLPPESHDYVFMLAAWMFASAQGILSPLEGSGTPKLAEKAEIAHA